MKWLAELYLPLHIHVSCKNRSWVPAMWSGARHVTAFSPLNKQVKEPPTKRGIRPELTLFWFSWQERSSIFLKGSKLDYIFSFGSVCFGLGICYLRAKFIVFTRYTGALGIQTIVVFLYPRQAGYWHTYGIKGMMCHVKQQIWFNGDIKRALFKCFSSSVSDRPTVRL